MLAKALGLRLKDIAEVSIGAPQYQPVFYRGGRSAMASMDAATPVESGDVKVTAEVTVVFRAETAK